MKYNKYIFEKLVLFLYTLKTTLNDKSLPYCQWRKQVYIFRLSSLLVRIEKFNKNKRKGN